MKKLNWDFLQLTKQHREGAYGTQDARWRALNAIANQLEGLGFKNLRAKNLKIRHIEAQVKHWQQENLSTGTLKNNMAHLRWATEKTGNSSVIPKDNLRLGIPDRAYVTNISKATVLDDRLAQVKDPNIALSLELQAAFGLRKEESMKLQPAYADHGDKLMLKSSWTKGGRPRAIPIRNAQQREVLDRALQMAGNGSMIPPWRSYKDQIGIYDRECRRAGLLKNHGLRHAYAQTRYRELTGWDCPAVGGTTSRHLTPEEKITDREVRLQISEEMGHGREQVTAVYIGR